MKKKLKLLFLGLCVLIIPTGCMKIEGNIQINKDKSMTYSIIEAIDTSQVDPNDQSLNFNELTQDEINEFKKAGISVEEYEEDKYKGYKYIVNYDSIDDISSVADIDGCTIDIENKNVSTLYCFKKEKGFFQDKYIAKFAINGMTDNINKEINAADDTEDESNKTAMDPSMLYNMFDIKFKINTPFPVLASNATSKNGDTLTWDFKDKNTQKIDNIEFTFFTPNMLNIIIFIVALVIIVFLTVSIIISKIINKNNNKDISNNSKEEEEVLEVPQEVNPKIKALLSDDGSNVNNL